MPALAEKVDLNVGVEPSFEVGSQMEVQQGFWRASAGGGAVFRQRFLPCRIGAEAGGAANGGIMALDLPVEHDLGGGIAAGLFVGQDYHQALSKGSKAAFGLAFGLRAGTVRMGYPPSGIGASELRVGIMAKEAKALRALKWPLWAQDFWFQSTTNLEDADSCSAVAVSAVVVGSSSQDSPDFWSAPIRSVAKATMAVPLNRRSWFANQLPGRIFHQPQLRNLRCSRLGCLRSKRSS